MQPLRWVSLVSLVVGCGARSPGTTGSSATPPAAMRVYKDPATGRFIEPPPGSAAQHANAAFSGAPALQEIPSPGGGTMVRLNGHFQANMRASVSEAGVRA